MTSLSELPALIRPMNDIKSIGELRTWPDGSFYSYNLWGAYWSSTETDAVPTSANYRQLGNSTDQLENGSYWSVTGCSVRCVED